MAEKYEDLFDRDLSEYTEQELLDLAEKVKTERRYPSVTTAKNKKTDAIDRLINEFVIKQKDNNEENSNPDNTAK